MIDKRLNLILDAVESYSTPSVDAAVVEITGFDECPHPPVVLLTFKYEKGEKKTAYVGWKDLVEALDAVKDVYGKKMK